jgi:hypothetical protein
MLFIEREVSYMNLELNYEGLEQYLFMERELMDGYQYIFKFPNEHGASVIKHRGSYGSDEDLWELAVVEFIDEHDHWGIKYTTPITDNVLGWLTDEDVRNYLKQIEEL